MFSLLRDSRKFRAMEITILCNISSPMMNEIIHFGPFNSNMQKRWKKPVNSAQTRLENRTIDLKLDKLVRQHQRLKIILKLRELMLKRSSDYVSVQILARWRNAIGLNLKMGVFLRKYPHIFEVYTHHIRRNLCCKLTRKVSDLIDEESVVIKESESLAVQRLKKLLMISTNGTLHCHVLWLIRRELGLPDDFKDSILLKYPNDFVLVDHEILQLVSREDSLGDAAIERWREKEYTEKWLSEFETRYAFPIQFPTGFKIEKGFREKLKNWQRLPYVKPYEKMGVVRVRSHGGVERVEKRVVGILHEFLSLTVEKMVEVERLSHFRKDFDIKINLRELLLRHPGIFYVSTKGLTQTVILRDSYSKGCLVDPDPIYAVRRKMLDLVLLGRRNSRELRLLEDGFKEKDNDIVFDRVVEGPRLGDWVIPILDKIIEHDSDGDTKNINDSQWDLTD